MSIELATFIAHDGKALLKVIPPGVNCMASRDHEYTGIQSGFDQTMDVTGGLKAAEQLPS